MLRLVGITDTSGPVYTTLTLPFEHRIKSRLKVCLDNGKEAGLFLERGIVLKNKDKLKAASGEVVEIRAAKELVTSLYIDDPLLKARACYHLGNRHVPLQITASFVRYQHDHVLDDMVRGLGLRVVTEKATFEPEQGAYTQLEHHKDDH